jgi:hypothetical protein
VTDLFQDEKDQEHDQLVNELNERMSLLKDWKDTFSTGRGRRVLLDILDSTFMHDTVFTGNSKTYYNAAFQDYGKKILDTVASADPDTYLWIHTQRINHLRKIMDEEISSIKRIEEVRNK